MYRQKTRKSAKLYDVDHNEYIDYLLCYGSLITGHGHPDILEAVQNQLHEAGTTIFGTPHKLEIDMARKLIDLYPGIEMVRYTNSGLEATLLAIRTANAYTGKNKIAKFEGHYHGGYDQVLVSVNPPLERAGRPEAPTPVNESKGMPDEIKENTVILPFNDLSATKSLLRKHAAELSAVVMEPVQGGFIPAEQDFMDGLRKITEELGIVLIFDEVKSGI
ncbi:aminotransferase class III-fold pyridoxal phosphate-dependent enzyme [Halobacillus massiliensis]|uniref:aminotransferase class III-fold pyridoxal phosphate-dependent enzyme n=1 Tax=Halobacillus massiliensis TaxID=1926286 RepID=UPI003182ECF9